MSKGTIAIIGGGIGGIAAGVALRQSGFTVRVFERAHELREAGTGIILWPNATGILHKLGALSEILSQGHVSKRFLVRSHSGDSLMDINTAVADMPTVGVHRADLLRALAELLPEECVGLGYELTAVGFPGRKVRLEFSNGETFLCDGLVGADGIHSRVRSSLVGAHEAYYRGYAIFRGLVEAPASLVQGHNGESWGLGRRFGILAVGKNRICWYATANTSDPQLLADDRKQRLQQLFAGWHDPVPQLIAASHPAEILLNPACDHRISRFWSKKAVTLLGDAAHALTPNLGQGACMALEDGFVLAQCLAQSAGVSQGFRRYESLRFSPVRNAVLRSRWIGHVGQWENRLITSVRDAVTRLLPPRMFECHTTLEQRTAALLGTGGDLAADLG
jgi:2-polyprenyl-6-methoxyphenol hydroxylase-like FAD-dependent oxidoreductase